jgi:hypothetical protein
MVHAAATALTGQEPGTHWLGGCVGPTASLFVVSEGNYVFGGNRTPLRSLSVTLQSYEGRLFQIKDIKILNYYKSSAQMYSGL